MAAKSTFCKADPATPTTADVNRELTDGDARHSAFTSSVRAAWMLRVGRESLLIRPTTPRDLEAVSAMHRRCSAASILERYRLGGKRPSVLAVQQMLRRPLSFVACRGDGSVVAWTVASIDVAHGRDRAEVGLLVEDAWQDHGIGRELTAHLAGAALVCGYTELIAYPATSVIRPQRLLIEVGHTRIVMDPQRPHLHTSLPEAAALGLGPVRERLAS